MEVHALVFAAGGFVGAMIVAFTVGIVLRKRDQRQSGD